MQTEPPGTVEVETEDWTPRSCRVEAEDCTQVLGRGALRGVVEMEAETRPLGPMEVGADN